MRTSILIGAVLQNPSKVRAVTSADDGKATPSWIKSLRSPSSSTFFSSVDNQRHPTFSHRQGHFFTIQFQGPYLVFHC
jgi:hypothetical protein